MKKNNYIIHNNYCSTDKKELKKILQKKLDAYLKNKMKES